ncbi:thiamine pyrophosphate-dependent enzyme [Fimbriiglobus ruber]|uniref:Sulfopyruvate decarboxylase-beta subunit n=1 Tax=Fimbriiglobus ruber TaxID=1908690 RepID=A0A225E5U5_9BACT|nr:thiamine pyrophosphate-dependent enzyme [Fimbriiglobus ruber]OWK47134.1 Sulfopyruvate decarboxylase - beta subunit [Fimbriiglobus ruber]
MMTHREALEVVAAHREDRVVIATMGSVAIWPQLSDTPLDFAYLPSSMGQAIPLGLGLALAKPGLGVVVLNGDGGLLMNLGCLVTLAQHDVPVTVVLIDNGLYEVTGGQPVVGAGRTDFAGLARAAGISRVFAFATAEAWRSGAKDVFAGTGPAFVSLKVAGEVGKPTPTAPRPMAEQIHRLRGAIGVSVT